MSGAIGVDNPAAPLPVDEYITESEASALDRVFKDFQCEVRSNSVRGVPPVFWQDANTGDRMQVVLADQTIEIWTYSPPLHTLEKTIEPGGSGGGGTTQVIVTANANIDQEAHYIVAGNVSAVTLTVQAGITDFMVSRSVTSTADAIVTHVNSPTTTIAGNPTATINLAVGEHHFFQDPNDINNIDVVVPAVATSGGGGAVDSVFGRSGDVVAAAGDYSANEVDVSPSGILASTDVQAALEELQDEICGVATITLSNSNIVLTAEQEGHAILDLTGNITADITVSTDQEHGRWVVINNTTGDFEITFGHSLNGTQIKIPRNRGFGFYGAGTGNGIKKEDPIVPQLINIVSSPIDLNAHYIVAGNTTPVTLTVQNGVRDFTVSRSKTSQHPVTVVHEDSPTTTIGGAASLVINDTAGDYYFFQDPIDANNIDVISPILENIDGIRLDTIGSFDLADYSTLTVLSYVGHASERTNVRIKKLGSAPAPIQPWHFQDANSDYWEIEEKIADPRFFGDLLGATAIQLKSHIEAAILYCSENVHAREVCLPNGDYDMLNEQINLASNLHIYSVQKGAKLQRTVDVGASPPWVTATSYVVGDRVYVSSVGYRCIQNHTSSASDQPGTGGNWTTYWEASTRPPVFYGGSLTNVEVSGVEIEYTPTVNGADTAWVSGTPYTVDDIIYVGKRDYKCIQAHTSSATDEPGTGANWEQYWEALYTDPATNANLFSAIYFTDSDHINIKNNKIVATFKSGIVLNAGVDCFVEHNEIIGIDNRPIYLSTSCDRVEVASNKISGFKSGTTIKHTDYGVNLLHVGAGELLGVIVRNNKITGANFQAIAISGTTLSAIVADNHIEDVGTHGILLQDITTSPTSISVTGNVIKDAGTFSIYVLDAFGCAITGNTVLSSGNTGIYIENGGDNCVTGNTSKNGGTWGIRLNNSTRNAICGNTIVDNANVGVQEDTGADYNSFTGNISLGNLVEYGAPGANSFYDNL